MGMLVFQWMYKYRGVARYNASERVLIDEKVVKIENR